MTENSIVNLLIVDRIDAVSQPLRDGGFIVQAERLEQEADVLSHVKEKPVDLIIIRPQDGLISVAALTDALRSSGNDVPLLAVPGADAADLLAAGVDALCDPEVPAHLCDAVRKEIGFRQSGDRTEQHEAKLKEAEDRSRSILDAAREAIAYIHEGVHMYANPAYLSMFGYVAADDLEGVTLMDLVAEDDRNDVKRFLRDSTKQGHSAEPLAITGVRSDGGKMPVTMRCQLTRIDDEPCLQIFVSETEDGADDGKISSGIDSLTKLYNRKFFVDYLDKRLQDDEKKTQGAVLYVLLEAYRPLSARFGLAAGDVLMSDLAPKIAALLSEHDVLSRFADGALCVYLPEGDRKSALALTKKINETVKSNTCYLAESLLTSNASIGVALLEYGFDDALTLLSAADSACSEARKSGGDRTTVASQTRPDVDQVEDQRGDEDDAVNQIHAAITAERMRLLYQPVVSFAEESDQRYQAMLEIMNEADEPLDMIRLAPIAENTNLMLPLDKWAIVTALGALTERYQGSGPQTSLFVRVSGNAIHDKKFASWLQQRLDDTGLSGGVLIVEVLESVAEKYFKEAKPFREQLRDIGCGFALASFGGKANSERILKHLQPDYIKLESELIEKGARSKDPSVREEITHLTQEAQTLNARVVAANIANANQMASIWQFGVTLVQGDMVHEPDAEMAFDFAEFAG